jgi:hypothetical protein
MPDDLSAQHINRVTVYPFILRRGFPDDWLTANRISHCKKIHKAAIRFAGEPDVSFSRMTVKRVSSRRGCADSDRLLV